MASALPAFCAVVRWSYTLSSPNCAALVIALLLPVLWWLWPGRSAESKRAPWQVGLVLCVEAALCFLLAKTLSRGGFIAAVAGLTFFHVLTGRRAGITGRMGFAWRAFIVRLSLYFAAAFAGGLYARSNLAYVAEDRSVLNRIDVWKGACALVAYSPARGWGFANSGKMYVNWIQEHSTVHVYRGVMNVFLQLAVELGLPVALVALAAALTMIVWPLFESASSPLAIAASSAICVWLIANTFSTLGEDWEVYAMILAWVGVWLSQLRAAPLRWAAPVTTAAVATVVVGAGIYAAGCHFKSPLAITDIHRKGVAVSSGKHNFVADVYLDLQVLGRVPGQRLRRVLGGTESKELRIWSEGPSTGERAPVGVFFGRTCRLEAIQQYQSIILVNPPQTPCGESIEARHVALVISDADRGAPTWLALAREKGWSVFVVAGPYPYLEEAQDPIWYAAIAS